MRYRRPRGIATKLLALFLFFPSASFAQENPEPLPTPPFAEDASDRAYLPRALQLIDSAQESIDIAMFAVNVRPVPRDPGYQLLERLTAASQNGRRVRLWLNSRQTSVGSSRIFMRRDIQEELEKKGIEILYVDSSFRLHDKLIIVDRKIVVDGSMNWTREALLKNFESATVIHSEELSQKKIARLESLPLLVKKDELRGSPHEETFSFPVNLLRNPQMFPVSLEGQEARTLALYLLLLERSSLERENSFAFSLEEWGEKLPFKKRWIGPSLRHEMRRVLDLLKTEFSLIDWEKLGPIDEVSKEFSLSPVTLIRGLWELRRANLIEIFPSEKKEVGGRWEREFTNRYLFNPILLPKEREMPFENLKARYGKARTEEAQRLADLVDEPEDPQVIEEFARFLSRYPAKEVERATHTVARFNRNNALRTPAYIRGILEAGQSGNLPLKPLLDKK